MLRGFLKNKDQKRRKRDLTLRSIGLELELSHSSVMREEIGVGNTKDENIIFSLTSFPDRIDMLHVTIESLFRQSLMADKVILWLTNEEFPHGDKEIPESLRRLQPLGLEIHFVDSNWGPYNKLLHALKNYPGSHIVTVDDDVMYPADLLQSLYRSYQRFPRSIHCGRAHRIGFEAGKILPYPSWKPAKGNNEGSLFNFPMGHGGVWYPPACLAKHTDNAELFMSLSPFADDVWFKAMSLLQGVECVAVGGYDDSENHFLTIKSLGGRKLKSINKRSTGGNSDKVKAVFDYFELWSRLS